MEKRNKIIAAYGSAVAIIIAITLFAAIYEYPKGNNKMSGTDIISAPETEENIPGGEKDNEPLPKVLPGGDNDELKDSEENLLGGGGATKPSAAYDQPSLPICPSKLDVEYFIDYKKTTSTKDDDIYLGIRNSKPQIERISISIDDDYEGTMEVRSLGVSVMKSPTITAWWDLLNEATSKTFIIQLVPENCMMIVSQVTINYPPSETDYLD